MIFIATKKAPLIRGNRSSLHGNPYYFLGPRPYRLARLRSYIVREHRRGRSLSDIVGDPYVRRLGGGSLLWAVLEDPQTIGALEEDIRAAIERERPVSGSRRQPGTFED